MNKPRKIFHSGDQHVFFSKKFEAHEYVFQEFYKALEIEKPDLVVLTGDLIDSKLKLSPEQFTLARSFLLNITSHCPVIIILGNHDLNLANKDRLDSISPIVHSLYNETEFPIHFLKHSGIYDLYDIEWAVWSCLDNQAKPNIPKNKYTVGLYHGTVKGCISENGFTLTEGIDIEEFNEANIVMLGDIHQPQFFRGNEIGYSGPLLQTKVSESAFGSYIQWEWNGKTYLPSVKELKNIHSSVVTEIDSIDTSKISDSNQLLILKYDSNKYTKAEAVKLKKELQSKFSNKIELKPSLKKKVKQKEEKVTEKVNLKNALEEYLNFLKLENSDKKQVLEMDEFYANNLDLSKDFEYGDFSLKEIKVNNFLCFGPKTQVIDFDKNGIIGISGKNKVGKSSIISAVQFCLYNTSKSSNSTLKRLINKHNRTKECFVELLLEKGNSFYSIKRKLIPKKKEGITIDLDFDEVDLEGNVVKTLKGEKRQETEKEIQKLFGIESAFEIMSLYSAQKKQVEFIDCKNSERLTLINRFLGLQYFEIKEKEVAEDLKAEKSINQSILKDFNKSIDLSTLEAKLDKAKSQIQFWESEIENYKESLVIFDYKNRHLIYNYELVKKIASKKVENPEDATEKNEKILNEIQELQQKILSELELKELKEKELKELEDKFLLEYNDSITKYKINYKETREDSNELAVLLSDIKREEKSLSENFCGSCNREFSEEMKLSKRLEIKNWIIKSNELKEKIESINIKNEKIDSLQDLYKSLQSIIEEKKNNIKRYKSLIENKNSEIELLNLQTKDYDSVIEAKEKLLELDKEYQKYLKDKKELEINLSSAISNIGSEKTVVKLVTKEIEDYKEKYTKLLESEEKIRVLKLYKDIIHKDGLPLFILKTKLSEINNQVNLIVNQVFEFEIEFSIDEEAGELNIEFFYENDEEKNDVGFASGAETFIINLCIKVGLSQISELPKLTSLLIDEGYGTLDKENLDKIPALFDVLPEYYKSIITVSHIDELKDLYQSEIKLEKNGNYTDVVI